MTAIRPAIYAALLYCLLAVGCSTPSATVDTEKLIPHLLSEARHSEALARYTAYSAEGEVDGVVADRFGPYFEVIALYSQPAPPSAANATYDRYASCVELTYYGEPVVEWRPIAAQGNPFKLSNQQVQSVQQSLSDRGYWRGPTDGPATVELQMAISYYRYLHGADVQCVLYPHDLMLKSTYCMLFDEDVRCQEKYEF